MQQFFATENLNPLVPNVAEITNERLELEQQLQTTQRQISKLLDDSQYLETESEHQAMREEIDTLVVGKNWLVEQINQLKDDEKRAARVMRFPCITCKFCGKHQTFTAPNGFATWDVPHDDCCIQRAEEVIAKAKKYIDGLMQKEAEKEKAFHAANEREIQAELERQYGKPNQEKIERLRARVYITNRDVVQLILGEKQVIARLEKQLAGNQIPDAGQLKIYT
jgi:hypothetical protein